jgi:hypothetical protein
MPFFNKFSVSPNPDGGYDRVYIVSQINTSLSSEGFTKVVTQGILYNLTEQGGTPVNMNPNGVYIPLDTVGATLESLENLTALQVSQALGNKPVETVTFADFYQVALAQGIASSDANGRFNVS